MFLPNNPLTLILSPRSIQATGGEALLPPERGDFRPGCLLDLPIRSLMFIPRKSMFIFLNILN